MEYQKQAISKNNNNELFVYTFSIQFRVCSPDKIKLAFEKIPLAVDYKPGFGLVMKLLIQR